MKHYPKVKEGLLKSGLPLEFMVARALASLSSELPHPLINMGEYLFERPGSALPHSVDFLFTHDLDVKNRDFLQLVFLIECKYRTRGTTWFFMQHPHNDAGMEFFVEHFFAKGKCDRHSFPSLAPPLGLEQVCLAGKGVEVYSTGQKNERSIRGGIHQLMFAASNMLIRAFLRHEVMIETMRKRGIGIKGRSFHSLVCPILTTSAQVCFLKEMTVEEIEKSKRLEDIAQTENMIVTSPKLPPYVRRYITETVFENAMSMLKSYTTSDVDAITRMRIKDFLLEYSLLFPSRYYVLNYQNVQEFVRAYISYAEGLLTISQRTTDPELS